MRSLAVGAVLAVERHQGETAAALPFVIELGLHGERGRLVVLPGVEGRVRKKPRLPRGEAGELLRRGEGGKPEREQEPQ